VRRTLACRFDRPRASARSLVSSSTV
jgi:hypothetical protein